MKDPRKLWRRIEYLLSITCIDVLIREIRHIEKQKSIKKIRILDIGAGSARYWVTVAEKLPTIEIHLTCMDAKRIDTNPIGTSNLLIQRVEGLVPTDLTDFEMNSYDLVTAFDLIEHLTKEDGYMLLYEIDRISSKSSVIFTPNGFVWQPPSVNNPFNAHICGWTPNELARLGWSQVRGHLGPKIFVGAYGIRKKWLKSWVMMELFALTSIITFLCPRTSFAFSAVKRIKNPRINEQEFE